MHKHNVVYVYVSLCMYNVCLHNCKYIDGELDILIDYYYISNLLREMLFMFSNYIRASWQMAII